MNTLIAVSIAPFGIGETLSEHVVEIVKVIETSGNTHTASRGLFEVHRQL